METGVQHGNGNSNNATQLICEFQAGFPYSVFKGYLGLSSVKGADSNLTKKGIIGMS